MTIKIVDKYVYPLSNCTGKTDKMVLKGLRKTAFMAIFPTDNLLLYICTTQQKLRGFGPYDMSFVAPLKALLMLEKMIIILSLLDHFKGHFVEY